MIQFQSTNTSVKTKNLFI